MLDYTLIDWVFVLIGVVVVSLGAADASMCKSEPFIVVKASGVSVESVNVTGVVPH